MDTYWILEYGKIFAGYVFLMFIWPMVVFRRHLRKKSKVYQFGFCTTTQIVMINTIVLTLGFFHILNKALVAFIFYGVFFVAVCRSTFSDNSKIGWKQIDEYKIKTYVLNMRNDFCSKIGEYFLLLVVISFGVCYFSYGAFQVHSYGCYDVLTHHGWVNEMQKGIIFPDGIYPAAMHSFIYCLNALFGIRVYSIMLFLQCIHIITFLLSAYCLFREVFSWRYSPIFAIGLFLMIDVNTYHGMYRLPVTLPMEFGLHTQFLCALFLIRYLEKDKNIVIKDKISKLYWNENLIIFVMALSASMATHYYDTIMAFIVCTSFAMFRLKRIFHYKFFFPLFFSVLCGCLITMTLVIGALASGIPFEGSIKWGIRTISSNSDTNSSPVSVEADVDDSVTSVSVLEPTYEDWKVIEKLPKIPQTLVKNIIKAEKLIKITYRYGYQGTFKVERGRRIFQITMVVILLCFGVKVFSREYFRKISSMYFPVILISFIAMLIYAAYASRELGLPVIIPNHRFCPEGFLMVFVVMMMPADMLFSWSIRHCKDSVMQMLSYSFVLGLYIFMHAKGIFHEYLYYSLTRYDAAALVTNSIIEEFERNKYTIISPNDEKYQVASYGSHEEISLFLEKCKDKYFAIPTEYVFIYVEKKPIEYYQDYYFNGPAWLARSRESKIKATEISEEAAREEFSGYPNGSWDLYRYDRTVLESKAYEWCQNFSSRYPSAMQTYYEDEDFVCYYFEQDEDDPYNLAGECDEVNFVRN